MRRRIITGVEPEAPIVTNEQGGRQSDTAYAFHLLPVRAMFAAARVARYGADRYGETFTNRNYTKIPPEEHANHAIQHLFAYLAGDTSEDHIGHAIVRTLFTYEVEQAREDDT